MPKVSRRRPARALSSVLPPQRRSSRDRRDTQPRRVGVREGVGCLVAVHGLTFGIYYLVWYYKINAELRDFAPEAVQVSPGKAVLAQLLPIFAWVSLAHTSTRLNNAHRAINSPVRVSGGVAILGTFWFNSQTRYLQRRLNSLWDAQDTRAPAHGTDAPEREERR